MQVYIKNNYPYKPYFCGAFSFIRNKLTRNKNISGMYNFDTFEKLKPTINDNTPEINILQNVRESYVSIVKNTIREFPQNWIEKFKQEGYKIIISRTLKEAYNAEKIIDKNIEKAERENPFGTLGVTYWSKFGKKFFVFCDKPPYSDKAIKNIVFHEFSHGVVNSLNLDLNKSIKKFIKNDLKNIKKNKILNSLSSSENQLISHFLFREKEIPVREIIADTHAWQKGAGLYGSGLYTGKYNPNLMKTLFPELNNFLQNI